VKVTYITLVYNSSDVDGIIIRTSAGASSDYYLLYVQLWCNLIESNIEPAII